MRLQPRRDAGLPTPIPTGLGGRHRGRKPTVGEIRRTRSDFSSASSCERLERRGAVDIDRGEPRERPATAAPRSAAARAAASSEPSVRAALELAHDLARARDHRARQAGEPRDVDAVALVRAARHDAAQEHDLALVLAHRDRHVAHARPAYRRARRARGSGSRTACARRSRRAGARRPPTRSTTPSNVDVPRPTSSSTTSERRVAFARIDAVSRISTMNVESPRDRLSAAPTRVNTRSQTPIVARLRRHEAADLREQHDLRDLAHVRRLAGHVRPGDQHELLGGGIEPAVVRHERAGRQHRLDHRVATVDDVEQRARRRRSAGSSRGVAATVGERARTRRARRARRRRRRPRARARRRAATSARNSSASRRRERVLGGQHLALELGELGRDVALAGRDRLLADVVRRAPSRGASW